MGELYEFRDVCRLEPYVCFFVDRVNRRLSALLNDKARM